MNNFKINLLHNRFRTLSSVGPTAERKPKRTFAIRFLKTAAVLRFTY